MQRLLKISQQTLWQVIFKIVTTVGGFIILGIVSRNYGEEGIGNFTLALTYLAFFYCLVDFGFNGYILAKLQEENFSQTWRKLFAVRIVWGAILTLLAGLLPFLLVPHLTEFRLAVWMGLGTIFLNGLFFCAQAIFQAKLKYEYSTWPVFLSAPAGVLVIFYLAKSNFPSYFLTVGYVVSWIIYAGLTIFITKKLIKKITPIIDVGFTNELFKKSLPLAATLILNVIYFRIDAFILGYYQSINNVGVYNLAYQIFQAILVLPTYIMNSFYPMMLLTLKESIESFIRQIKLAIIGLFAASLFIGLVLFFLSPLVIKLISGGGFEGSVASLQILSVGLPAYFLSALFMWVMIAKGFRILLVLIYFIGLVFNIIANLYFIPQYSYIGASWVTVASEYLILLLQTVVLWRNSLKRENK